MRRTLLLLLLLAPAARADGKFFPGIGVPRDPRTPDQRALLVWEDGVERLVVESTLRGDGDRYAWIVPLPAAPEIAPASPGLFRTLEVLTQPEVVPRVEPEFDLVAVLAVIVVAAAVAIALGIPAGVTLSVTAIALVLGFFGGVALRGKGAVEALHATTRTVGAYEVATVSGTRADDVLAWLRDHGFRVAPEAESVIGDYVGDGWTFAAARLGGKGQPHPLSFTFPAERPVYPMRLTGVGNGPLELDLYVFGPGRAEVDGLAVERCAQVDPEPYDGHSYLAGAEETIEVVHPDLQRLAGKTRVVTQLTGTLSPGQMREDLQIGWTAFAPFRRTLYSDRAAETKALNVGGWIALATLIALLLLAARARPVDGETWQEAKRRWRRTLLRRLPFVIAGALVAGAAAGGIRYVSLDRIDVRVTDFGFYRHVGEQRSFPVPDGDVAAVRAAAREFWADTENPYQSGRVREEDSPGNYVVRERDGRVEYAYYDARGKEFLRTADDGAD